MAALGVEELKKMKEDWQAKKAAEKQKEAVYREELIMHVYERECIWNIKLVLHRNRVCVDAAWEEIAVAVNRPKDMIKKTWKSMRDHFSQIYAGVTKRKRSGDGLTGQVDVQSKIDTVKWPFFKSMLFLKDVCTVGERDDGWHNARDASRRRKSAEIESECSPESAEFEPESQEIQEDDPELQTENEELPADGFSVNDFDLTEVANEVLSGSTSCTESGQGARANKRYHLRSQREPPSKRRRQEDQQQWQKSLSVIDEKIRTTSRADSITRYCEHLGDLLRCIPERKLRSVFTAVSQLVNSAADGITPIVLPGTIILLNK